MQFTVTIEQLKAAVHGAVMGGISVAQGWRPTSPHGMLLAYWLRQHPGVTVVLVNPLHTHKLKEVDDHTLSKNDAKDAGIIAWGWSPRGGTCPGRHGRRSGANWPPCP